MPIGLDDKGREVALEFMLKTYGDQGDMKTTTDLEPHRGPWTRLAVVALVREGPAKTAGCIRRTASTWRELWVTREWLVDALGIWDTWHLNDVKMDPAQEGWLLQVLDKPTADGIIDLIDEGAAQSAARKGTA